MIEETGLIKICDFSCMQNMLEPTRPHVILDAPDYTAPELLCHAHKYTCAIGISASNRWPPTLPSSTHVSRPV
eukprot:m.140835 g.140835  ORF g.140835 m.140835 type:complete len:73 (+) comp52583_c0_seq2:940-1158(+)